MKTIKVNVKVMEGEDCIVLNYRAKPKQWEHGVVTRVGAGINKDGSYSVSYDVKLDRRTTGRSRMFPDGGAPIFLHVGDDGIEAVEE